MHHIACLHERDERFHQKWLNRDCRRLLFYLTSRLTNRQSIEQFFEVVVWSGDNSCFSAKICQLKLIAG